MIIDKDTDIYLKDFDLSYLGSLDLDSLIYITNGAKVNFYGTTTAFLSSTDPTGSCTIIASHNSVVNIYGGAFTSKTVPVIELHSGATLNIHRGLFYSEGYRGEGISTDSLINLTEDSNSQINVFGGAFVNFDPSATKIGNLLADDHVVLKTVRNQGEVWHAVIHKDYSHYTPVYDISEIKAAFESQADGIFLATDIEAEPNTESLMYGATSGSLNVLGNGSTIITRGTGTNPGAYDYGYVAFIPKKGCDATVTDLKVTGSGFFEIGDHGYGGGGKYTVENLVIEDLEATLFIENGGNYISPAFCHYGTATLTDCVMTGVTTQKTGYTPYDAGFVNGTKTFIEGGRYGSVYLSHQAHVTITGAVIDSIDSCAITTNNLGKLTLRAGTVVGTIRLTPGGYTPSIVIEEGAVVGSIIYNNVTYTLEEWLAR